MITVTKGLGYPQEDGQSRDHALEDLEEWRDHHYPDWSRGRAIFNLAILVAKGHFRGKS